MADSGFPCFIPRTLTGLIDRFKPEATLTEAAEHMKNLVCYLSF